jgi:DNA-binding beta-propeller fold protein YncE
MYHVVETIENDRAPSHVAEVSFHPSGSCFAATYEDINEVRIFDSRTRKLLQVLENPEAQIDRPHGVLFTEKYLLISNAYDFSKPGTINVYQNDSTIKKPIQVFESPFSHLREPHSLALRDGRLVATYAENPAPSGAIVSYAFNEETGKITGPLDKTETWFSEYGDPKGICFNADGTKIFVTFRSNKQFSPVRKFFRALTADRGSPVPTRLMNFGRRLKSKISRSGRAFYYSLRGVHSETSVALKKPNPELEKPDPELEGPNPEYVMPTKNGIAAFSINAQGKIARRPEHVMVRKDFCRLENIDIFDGTCAVTDPVNHTLLLYDLTQDRNFTAPVRTVNFGKATPHAATFSPDGRFLVISSLGRKIVNQDLRFRVVDWESPREDKIFILERSM